MQIDEYPILVEQLCPGLFIRIDEPGLSHPFPPKGFKLRTEAEVAKVVGLGLTHVYCVPDKSDRLPISLEELDGLAGKRQKGPWATARTPVSAELSSLKRETIERNKDRLERFAACERRYEKAMDKVVEAIKKVSSPNAEVLEAAGEVVGPMAEMFLSDLDVLINVMTAKMRDEAKHYHALNVAVLSMMLAKEMGLGKVEIEEVGVGSLFHDVGKGRVPIQRFFQGQHGDHEQGAQGILHGTSQDRGQDAGRGPGLSALGPDAGPAASRTPRRHGLSGPAARPGHGPWGAYRRCGQCLRPLFKRQGRQHPAHAPRGHESPVQAAWPA
ncbi:HD-GYP domain [Desulfovibrio sp. DV]|nr:HD-GYP domain [Desulfovibrio sp. DV]